MSPFTQAVVDPTIQALQQQQGQQLAQQQAQAIKSGAFGGDRAGLQRAALQSQQGLATAQAIAPLYQQGFQQAQGVAQQQQGVQLGAQQANRQAFQQAGQQLAGLGTGAQQAALQGAQAQIGAGTLQQQTQQAGLTAQYQQFLQQQGYPFQVAQFLAGIAEGTGALSGSTTTTQTSSDRRLKEDIKEIGQTNDGLPIYSYKYKGEDRTQIGLMAQDVEQVKPEAVGLAGGYKTVDYDKATEGSERHERYAGGGLMPSFSDYNSMGGAVTPEMQGQAMARGGYATDGSVNLGDILQAQASLYGAQRGQQGAQKGYFPFDPAQMAGQQRQLMLPSQRPQQPENEMMNAMKMAGATGEAFKGGKEIKQDLFGGRRYYDPEKKTWAEDPGWFSGWGDKSKPNTAPVTPPEKPTEVLEEASGGRIGYATIGGLPYGEGLAGGTSYIPEDVLKQQEASKTLQFKPGAPPKTPDQMSDAVKAVSALNTAKSLYKAPGEIKSGLTKVQNFFSPDKAATGATEAGKDATTVATEAVKGAPTTPVNPDLPASGAKAIEATNPAGVNPAGTYTIPGTTETVTPGLGSASPAPIAGTATETATGVVPEVASVVPQAATAAETGATLGTAAETGAALGTAAETAGAVAGGTEAVAAAGATMEELAPLLLMLLKRGGAAKPHYAKGYYSGGLVREHHDNPNDTNGQSNVVGDGDTGVIPPDMMAIARDPAEDDRMSERMRAALPKFKEAYPDLYDRVTSSFRTPEENKRVGGAKGSTHLEGKAIDLGLRGLDPDKQAEVLNWWRDQGAGGFGYYPNKEAAHVDFGSPRAWGPNYSRTSLHQTPQFFQKFAEAHTGEPVAKGNTFSDAVSGGARSVSDAVRAAPGVAYDYANKFLPESDDAKLALLAGIFGTLASPSPHRLGAIGQGGLAAISTYGQLRKMGNEQVKQTIEMMKGRFGEPVKVGDQWMVPDNWQGKMIPQSQVGDLYRQALSGSSTATGVKETTKPSGLATGATTERPTARTEDRPAATGVSPPAARAVSADRPVALDTTEAKPLSAYDTAQPSPIGFDRPVNSRFNGPDMPEDTRPAKPGAPGSSLGVLPEYATMFPQTEAAAMQDYKMPSDTVGLAKKTLLEQVAESKPTAESDAAPVVPPAAPIRAAVAPVPGATPGAPPAAPVEQRDKLAIKADLIRKGPEAFANVPADMNPVILRQKAAALQTEIERKTALAEEIESQRGSTPQAVSVRNEITNLKGQRKDYLDRSEKGLDEAAELIYGREKSLFEQQTSQQMGRQQAISINVPAPEGMTQAAAEFDPDYLASRSQAYMTEAKRLSDQGSIEQAEKARALGERDRANLVAMGNTERETPQGSRYVLRPGAPVYQPTPPKPRPLDYKAAVDPNTGIVGRKEVGEFIGHPETGGFAPDPGLVGRKLDLSTGADKVVGQAKALSQEEEKQFVEGASRAKEAIPTVMKAAVALKYIESKGLTMEKAEAANIANGLGLPGIANKIMSPTETDSAYIILKSSVDQAVQQISQNFARPTQGEFKLTKEEATTDPKLPVEASYSIAKTQLARALWQNALMSDWEDHKRQTGANNFVGFKDVWQKTHPSSLFEQSASRIMGNLKGQGLPSVSDMTEGALYVVPDSPKKGATERDSAFFNYLIKEKKLKPGDVFVAKNVNHETRNLDVDPVGDFKSAYNVALRAPALTYGVR